MRRAAQVGAAAALLLAGCAGPVELLRRRPIAPAVDAVIVPGCPCEPDGRLSACLRRRVLWAAHVWSRGAARRVVVSGAATYNRCVEAEAMAAGLAALDVPADRIFIEPNARHTDENLYYGMQVAERLGGRTFAVASDGAQASGGCAFLASWGRVCLAASADRAVVEADSARLGARLDDVRVPLVADAGWLPVGEYEARRVAAGGPSRPGSPWLYLVRAPLGRVVGCPWVPVPSPDTTPVSWAEREAARGGRPSH